MLPHVFNKDLEIPVWSGVVRELAVDIFVVTLFMRCSVRAIFLFLQNITFRSLYRGHISAIRTESKKTTAVVVANIIFTYTEARSQDDLRVTQETVILSNAGLNVLVVSNAADLGATKSKTPNAGNRGGTCCTRCSEHFIDNSFSHPIDELLKWTGLPTENDGDPRRGRIFTNMGEA